MNKKWTYYDTTGPFAIIYFIGETTGDSFLPKMELPSLSNSKPLFQFLSGIPLFSVREWNFPSFSILSGIFKRK